MICALLVSRAVVKPSGVFFVVVLLFWGGACVGFWVNACCLCLVLLASQTSSLPWSVVEGRWPHGSTSSTALGTRSCGFEPRTPAQAWPPSSTAWLCSGCWPVHVLLCPPRHEVEDWAPLLKAQTCFWSHSSSKLENIWWISLLLGCSCSWIAVVGLQHGFMVAAVFQDEMVQISYWDWQPVNYITLCRFYLSFSSQQAMSRWRKFLFRFGGQQTVSDCADYVFSVIVSKLYLDYVDFSLSLVARKLYQIYRFLFGRGNQQ